MNVILITVHITELQIRGGIKDNFSYFMIKTL